MDKPDSATINRAACMPALRHALVSAPENSETELPATPAKKGLIVKIIQGEYRGIKLIGGFQFWSNPDLYDTEQAIGIVLCRPTLIDLIRLVGKYGLTRLEHENTALFESGCLSGKTFARNALRLKAIGAADND